MAMLGRDKERQWQAQSSLALGQRVCALVTQLELCRAGKDSAPVGKGWSRSVQGLAFHLSDVWLEGLQETFLVQLLLYSPSWRDSCLKVP